MYILDEDVNDKAQNACLKRAAKLAAKSATFSSLIWLE